MSNIFLHFLQGVEKKEEIAISRVASYGTLPPLAISLY
jgi:hypothetical protein